MGLDRQKTLQNDLESLSTLIESNQSQKQGLQEDDIEHTRNLSHLLELTKDEIIEETLRENSSDELNSKLKQINDNNHILNTENIRLDSIKSSYQAASERQKEIIGVHQDEELRKYGQIKELEKQVQNVTDVLTIKKDPDRLGQLQQKEAKIKSQLDAQIAANNAT